MPLQACLDLRQSNKRDCFKECGPSEHNTLLSLLVSNSLWDQLVEKAAALFETVRVNVSRNMCPPPYNNT